MVRIAALLLIAAPALAGCDPLAFDVCYACIKGDPNAVLSKADQAKVAIIGTKLRLPASAHDVRYHEECGIDCMQWVTFDAPGADARAFVAAVLEKPPGPAPDDLAGPEKAIDWWPATLPTGAVGGMLEGAGTFTRVAMVANGGTARVWVRAFNT